MRSEAVETIMILKGRYTCFARLHMQLVKSLEIQKTSFENTACCFVFDRNNYMKHLEC